MTRKQLLLFVATLAACGRSPNPVATSQEAALKEATNDSDDPNSDIVVRFDTSADECTGTLISSNTVLTAKHCVTGSTENSPPGGAATFPITISIGADSSNFKRQVTVSTPAQVQPFMNWEILVGDQERGIDLALLTLDQPLLDIVVVPHPTLVSPTWPGDSDGGTYSNIGMAGWAPAEAPRFRQASIYASVTLHHYPGWPDGMGQIWDRGVNDLDHGDSGGPLFVVVNGQRQIIGVADGWAYPALNDCGLGFCDIWTDVTRGVPHDWIVNQMTAADLGKIPGIPARGPHWWASHPGYQWTGEVDYYGACRTGDADCDHWLDSHDNCPNLANFDQRDSDDDGVGDACAVTTTSVTPSHGPKEGNNSVTITGTGFTTDFKTGFTFGGVGATNISCQSTTSCTANTPMNGGAFGLRVQGTVPVLVVAPGRINVGTPATYTYDGPPAAPTCSESVACPASYGMPLETVQCSQNVAFYQRDGYTGSISAYPSSGSSLTVSTTTYMPDSLLACPIGLDTSWWATGCVAYSMYEPATSECGTKNTIHICSKGTHWCGDDEGCLPSCN